MRIAFQGSLGFGGLGTVTRELSKSLSQQVDVTVFDVLRSFQVGMRQSEVGRIGISKPTRLRGLPVNLPFQALGFRSYDLVHVNYASYGLSALVSNQFSGPPFIETVHGIPQSEFDTGYDKLGYVAEQWAIRATSRKASLVVADSDFIRHELRKRFGIRSTMIHLGVDTDRFAPPTREESLAARERLGIGMTVPVVLYAGRLTPWKDPLTLLRAARLVINERKDVQFHIVGRGPLIHEATRMIKVLQLGQNAFISTGPDYLHGLVDYYKAADVFVLTTRKEGFGLVVLEAMASGLCVIASDGGAPPELLGGSGMLFETQNAASLAESILKAFSDGENRRKLGNSARERVSQMFTWKKCAEAYERIYKELTGVEQLQ